MEGRIRFDEENGEAIAEANPDAEEKRRIELLEAFFAKLEAYKLDLKQTDILVIRTPDLDYAQQMMRMVPLIDREMKRRFPTDIRPLVLLVDDGSTISSMTEKDARQFLEQVTRRFPHLLGEYSAGTETVSSGSFLSQKAVLK